MRGAGNCELVNVYIFGDCGFDFGGELFIDRMAGTHISGKVPWQIVKRYAHRWAWREYRG